MKITQIKTDDLKPYKLNAKKHPQTQVEGIAESIRRFGFTQPIVIDGSNEIIIGHGRLEAAKLAGLKDVPCIKLSDLSKDEVKALRLIDNRIAETEWDRDLLALEFNELDFDFSRFNINFEEFQPEPEEVKGLTDEDAVPEVPKEPKTKLGQIFKLGDHRLMCGDSTSEDDVAKLMGGGVADMVFTDPPYGVDYKGINNDSRSGLEELLRGAFGNYLSVCKSGASIYCFHSDKCADIFNLIFREFFHFSSMIIWAKNSLTLSQTDYQSQHEPCLYGWMNNGTHSWYSDRKQTSIWRFDKERVEGHTTPKPVALIEKAILNSSKSDDIIIDLFGGSGSTMIACEKTSRASRIMELDPKYCDVIIKRWEDFTGKKAELVNA